jgi:hypothetical protein
MWAARAGRPVLAQEWPGRTPDRTIAQARFICPIRPMAREIERMIVHGPQNFIDVIAKTFALSCTPPLCRRCFRA